MKLNQVFIIISLFLILILSIGTISASEDSNTVCLSVATDDDIKSDNVIVVKPGENPNQIVNPTIQPAIDEADSGDTIILNGSFAHCQFSINKTLNIFSSPGNSVNACPHYQTEGSGSYGIFYVTEGANGSVFNGITFKNNARAQMPFSFLIRGASDISITDCNVDYDETDEFKFQGIVIENSNNIKLYNVSVGNSVDGIKIINSSNIEIIDCVISNNLNQAVSITGNSANILIKRNKLENNGLMGIRLTSADNISILNNHIRNNGVNNGDTGSGIYVNTNITKLTVRGNIFMNNGLHAIMYDYRCRNLNKDIGDDLLTDVDNNYFEGHSSMILHHRIYVERDHGEYKYDAVNDVYGSVGEGKYAEGKSYVYMKHAFIFQDVPCGFTYYTTAIPWTLEFPANGGKYDLSLKLDLKQLKNGLYQVSIVDSKGNVAKDFSSIDMVVFLNDYLTVQPRESDVYRIVPINNGVGIADFRNNYSLYKTTENKITAAFLGMSAKVVNNAHVQLAVNDSDIPINPATKLVSSKLITYPLSGEYLSVKLLDSAGRGISGQKITFVFNGKSYVGKTNSNGIAKVKVSLSSKKGYVVTLTYSGSDDYVSSKTTTKITVKVGFKKSKITSSNMKVKKNKMKSFSLKLTGSSGKALKYQKVLVKLNSKTYTVKTNGKGIARLSVKLSKIKKYKVTAKFLGNSDFKAVSKTNVITVFR
ncbi:right-handed parallel beta-helix repeat-containing protein [Methanobrevibacter sp.]|uniref:right-handed parallel beta-helix repeat-containing protein n=1 Tax=Methanobrevibacter sp. TaxID=66852 RepID=UPI0038663D7D